MGSGNKVCPGLAKADYGPGYESTLLVVTWMQIKFQTLVTYSSDYPMKLAFCTNGQGVRAIVFEPY